MSRVLTLSLPWDSSAVRISPRLPRCMLDQRARVAGQRGKEVASPHWGLGGTGSIFRLQSFLGAPPS